MMLAQPTMLQHMRTDDDWKVNPKMCEDTKSESSFGLWRNDEEEWQSLQNKKKKEEKEVAKR